MHEIFPRILIFLRDYTTGVWLNFKHIVCNYFIIYIKIILIAAIILIVVAIFSDTLTTYLDL
jgi:hypothetical protein